MKTKSVTSFTISPNTAYSKYALFPDVFTIKENIHHLVTRDLNPKASLKYTTKNDFVNITTTAVINILQCNSYIERRYSYIQLAIVENSMAVALARARLNDKVLNI